MNLSDLFPNEDYRFAMRFERGRPADFFAPTDAGPRLLAERDRWLNEEPAHYAALLPGGEPLLAETLDLLRAWPATRTVACPGGVSVLASLNDGSPMSHCVELGRKLEADFLLLKADAAGAFCLLAGCVCFPSSWSLAEKMGRTL